MFIIKFNKMIHNKIVWGVFAAVVGLAFAAGEIFAMRGNSRNEGVGLVDGEPVAFRDFDIMRQLVKMELDRDVQTSDIDEENVWSKLAEVAEARKLGLTVSDTELGELLVSDPAFHNAAGQFDPVYYKNILMNQLGMTPATYEEILRMRILIGKLEAAVSAGAWVSPSAADEQARGMTDLFTIRTVVVTNDLKASKIKVEEEEIKAIFNDNREMYRIPDMMSVKYVEFPASDYVDKAEVSEDELMDYYEDNIDKYHVNTNGVDETLPFETVRSVVENGAKVRKAAELAANAAAEFADIFYLGDEEARGPGAFEKAALGQGITVHTSGLFTAGTVPPGVDGSSSFSKAAFELNADSDRDRYSDAIAGSQTSYVLEFNEFRVARDPEFEEIRERATADATDIMRTRMFSEKMDAIRTDIETAEKDGKSFDKILADNKLKPSTNMTITVLDAYGKLSGGTKLAPIMARMNVGEVSSVVYLDDSAAFIQVLDRKPGEELQMESVRTTFTGQIRQSIGKTVLEDWRAYNLGKTPIKSARRERTIASASEEEYAGDEE